MVPGKISRFNDGVDDVIWNGLLATVPRVPTGPVYAQYRQTLIDYLQGPEWKHFPHLPANASISNVEAYAGILNMSFEIME